MIRIHRIIFGYVTMLFIATRVRLCPNTEIVPLVTKLRDERVANWINGYPLHYT